MDGNLYVLSSAWGDEVTGTLAIYYSGTFYYFIPYEGMVKKVGEVYSEYVSGAWKSLYSSLPDYADDAAASAGGVVVGELYRTTSTIKVRVA